MEAKGVTLVAHRCVALAALVMTLAAHARLGAQGVNPTPLIQVRVVDELGAPIDAGRAVIDTLNRWVLIEKGMATIADLPAGKWLVAVRALGFRPESVVVQAEVRPSAIPTVMLHRIAQNLAPVEVTATLTSKDSAKLRGIEQRMRTAHGTLIKGDDLAVRNADLGSDPLASAHGFSRKSATVVVARGGCQSFPKADSVDMRPTRSKRKYVAVYLDGSRLPGGLEAINRMVPPSDILAIEAYPDVISAPFLWRTNDACAVVAFWTKKPPPVTVGR